MIIKKLINCARCEGTHKNLNFKKFLNPIKIINNFDSLEIVYTHFCLCPKNKQPILLKVDE